DAALRELHDSLRHALTDGRTRAPPPVESPAAPRPALLRRLFRSGSPPALLSSKLTGLRQLIWRANGDMTVHKPFGCWRWHGRVPIRPLPRPREPHRAVCCQLAAVETVCGRDCVTTSHVNRRQ